MESPQGIPGEVQMEDHRLDQLLHDSSSIISSICLLQSSSLGPVPQRPSPPSGAPSKSSCMNAQSHDLIGIGGGSYSMMKLR